MEEESFTTLGIYRARLRDAKVRLRTVDPEEMDRIVHSIVNGLPTLTRDVNTSTRISAAFLEEVRSHIATSV